MRVERNVRYPLAVRLLITRVMFELELEKGVIMTGYQRFVIVGRWIKAGKPMPLDEFAANVDAEAMDSHDLIVKETEPIIEEQELDDPLESIIKVFPGAIQLKIKK